MCAHDRILNVSGKCSDLFYAVNEATAEEHTGYVPSDINIGGGDYLEFRVCLECGHIMGDWPVSNRELFESFRLA